MSKAQGWILAALLLTAFINIAASRDAYDLLKQGHPVQSLKTATPKLQIYWVVAVIVLVLAADAVPTIAGALAALILLGAILQKGQVALIGVFG